MSTSPEPAGLSASPKPAGLSRPRILAAAAALQEFSAAQLASYCGLDPVTVEATLSHAADLVERTACGRWHVRDLTAARAASTRELPEARRHEPRPRGSPARTPAHRVMLADHVMLAEETLADCGVEQSPALRQVMSATARNSLLQILARILPSDRPWWQIDLTEVTWDAIDPTPDDPSLSAWRLRADCALAHLIDAEAIGAPVPADFLTRTAIDLSHAAESAADPRLSRLFEYFVNLTATLAKPAGLLAPDDPAPVRLLVALAWRRTRALASRDVRRGAKTLVQILRELSRQPRTLDDHDIVLYRVLERLPDGGKRVVAYRGLFDLLPRGQRTDRYLPGHFHPGVLIEAITDIDTSTQLESIASRLGNGLERSPSRSESAIIGETAHVLNDIAMAAAIRDRNVLPRSDLVRRELLELAGAAV